jgi:hypothetical protein
MMTDFDPNKYLTTRVHGGVREIVGEEAKKIRERVRERMMTDIVEKLRSSIGLYTTEAADKQLHNEAADEIERLRTQLTLAKAEIDGIHSLLEDVREDYFKERALVNGLLQAMLDHIGASLDYNRD